MDPSKDLSKTPSSTDSFSARWNNMSPYTKNTTGTIVTSVACAALKWSPPVALTLSSTFRLWNLQEAFQAKNYARVCVEVAGIGALFIPTIGIPISTGIAFASECLDNRQGASVSQDLSTEVGSTHSKELFENQNRLDPLIYENACKILNIEKEQGLTREALDEKCSSLLEALNRRKGTHQNFATSTLAQIDQLMRDVEKAKETILQTMN